MQSFKYVGRTADGLLQKGTMEATSQSEVKTKLRELGISPREITEKKQSFLTKDITLFQNKVKNEHFVIYSRQFATLIRAGITIVDATKILINQTESKSLKKILTLVEVDLKSGIALSDAIDKYPKIFPTLFRNMIRAGEMTGSLDETLEQMASYYEKQYNLKSKIRATLSYPILLLLLIIVVVGFLLVVIMPQFNGIYDQLGVELPVITKFVLQLSFIFQKFWWLFLLAVIIITLLISIIYRSNEKFKYSVHLILLRIPIFGKLLQKSLIARMSRTLSYLFSSAVPILDALIIVAKVVDNPIISKVVLKSRRSLEGGGSLSEPLSNHWVFPQLVHQMIAIGEQTGSLDFMLEKIAHFYEEDVDRTVETLRSLIEPMMIVVLAFVIGFIVLSIMLPMFTIFTEIQ